MFKALVTSVVLGLAVSVASAPLATATTPATSTLTCTASKTEITAGASLTVSTQLKVNTVAVGEATVELWVQEYPATDFTFALSTQTNGSGNASFTVSPTKQTKYKWKFDGDEATAPSTAQCLTIRVHTRVTMQLRDNGFISPGQKMVATGITTPAKPGATISIWRTTISNRTDKWFSGTVNDDGTYRLARTMRTNLKYKLYVVVQAHSGNLKGKSPSRDLYVS